MWKQVEWSIYEEGVSATRPPDGLECALGCETLVIVYVASQTQPSLTLLDSAHPDVRSISTVRGRTVGVLAAKLVKADYLAPDWRFHIEYDSAAVISGALLPGQICRVQCMTCEKQADSTGQTNDNMGPVGPSAYQIAVLNGFEGTEEEWLESLVGPPGADSTVPGPPGDDGWAPVLSVVTDGDRRVLQVTDWTGGDGAKPPAGKYVGADGLKDGIGDGVDIRGAQGLQGGTGPQGPSVADGDKGDIVVSGGAAVWTIEDKAVTLAKMADLPQGRVIGRAAGAGTGPPTALDDSQARAALGLAPVASSGDYADLINKPSLADVATSGDYSDLANRPSIPTLDNASVNAVLDDDPGASRTALGLGNAATCDVGSTSGTVCSGTDLRLSDARDPTSHTHDAGAINYSAPVPADWNVIPGYVSNALTELAGRSRVLESLVPVGFVTHWFSDTPPANWLVADGSTVLRSSYPALDAAIYCGNANNAAADWGYRCDNVNGTGRSISGNYLVLPDLRNRYVRGWESGGAFDLWTYYADEFRSHTHTANHVISGVPAATQSGAVNHRVVWGATATSATGGDETRPRTVMALPIIYAGP